MNARDGSRHNMSERRPTPEDLDGDTADRLLSGLIDSPDAPPGYEGVVGVLVSASAGATEAELAGEAEALAMFRAEFHETSVDESIDSAVVSLAAHRSRRMSRKAVLVGVVSGMLLASTGVAAASGGLPAPVQRVARETLSHIGVSVPAATPRPAAPQSSTNQRPTQETKSIPSTTSPAKREQQGTPPTSSPRPSSPPVTAPASPAMVSPSAPPSTVPKSSDPGSNPPNRPAGLSALSPSPTVRPELSDTRGVNPASTRP